ncbi:MAG: hypothetical protein ACE5K7_06885, partial [Phycisphaerae bacterium]
MDSSQAQALTAPKSIGGPLYPVQRAYQVARVDPLPALTANSHADAWAAAQVGRPFFECGLPESPARQTTLRMVRCGEQLAIRIDCRDHQPDTIRWQRDTDDIWRDDSVEILLTQTARPDFPYLHIQLNAGGMLSAERIVAPFAATHLRQAEPVPAGLIQARAHIHNSGWTAVLTLPLARLGVPLGRFYFNVVRNRPADSSGYAWCDLWRGTTHRPEIFAPAIEPLGSAQPTPAQATPAWLAVGLNELQLHPPAEHFKIRLGRTEVASDPSGRFLLPIGQRGPVDVELLDPSGNVIGTYHADLPRPLLIEAARPLVHPDHKQVHVSLLLNAAVDAADALLTATRDGQRLQQRYRQLQPGLHELVLPIPSGQQSEVHLEAHVPIQLPHETLT